MNGKNLEQLLKDQDPYSVDAWADKAKIAKRTLRGQLSRDFVKKEYMDKLLAAGLDKGVQKSAELGASKQVPVFDVDATAGNVTIFNEDRTEYIKSYISVPAFADCDMFITISGNSMYPKFCAGEMIALKKIEDFDVIAMGEAYIVVTKEQRLLKYIRKSKERDRVLLCSEHPDYEPFDIHKDKILHLYIVKGKITKTII